MKISLLVLSILVSYEVLCATFLTTKIIDRLKNSDGAIVGRYTGHGYKKLPSGDVVTEYIFSVDKFVGLAPNDILNRHSFKVIVPGGHWNGLHYRVSGTPSFEKNKKIVLMIRKGSYGYTLPDLALSKFKVIKKEMETTLVSSVFPDQEGVGKTSLSNFNLMVQETFGHELRPYEADKYVYKKSDNNVTKRSPASSSGHDESKEDNKRAPLWRYFWLILGLGSIGAMGSWLNKEMKD